MWRADFDRILRVRLRRGVDPTYLQMVPEHLFAPIRRARAQRRDDLAMSVNSTINHLFVAARDPSRIQVVLTKATDHLCKSRGARGFGDRQMEAMIDTHSLLERCGLRTVDQFFELLHLFGRSPPRRLPNGANFQRLADVRNVGDLVLKIDDFHPASRELSNEPIAD